MRARVKAAIGFVGTILAIIGYGGLRGDIAGWRAEGERLMAQLDPRYIYWLLLLIAAVCLVFAVLPLSLFSTGIVVPLRGGFRGVASILPMRRRGLTLHSVSVVDWQLGTHTTKAVRLWVTNDGREYLSWCRVVVMRIESLGDTPPVTTFRADRLTWDANNPQIESITPGPREDTEVIVGFRVLEDSYGPFQMNWRGIGKPTELPPGQYRIGLYAEADHKRYGSRWILVDTDNMTAVFTQPPERQ